MSFDQATNGVARQLGWWRMTACAALLLSGVVLVRFAAPTPAYGQVPDSGAQRDAMIKELQASNQKLAEIAGLLKEIRDQQPSKARKEAEKPDRKMP